jgi:hypothetical protein
MISARGQGTGRTGGRASGRGRNSVEAACSRQDGGDGQILEASRGPRRGRGGRIGRGHGIGQQWVAGHERSLVQSSSTTGVVDATSIHGQGKQRSFNVGDVCFTDLGGAFRRGIIIQVPVSRGPKFYRIKLCSEDGEEEEEEIVGQAGSMFHPDDKVPAMNRNDKRMQQDTSPWRNSRAKRFFQDHLLDDEDSIHNKTAEQVFDESIYSNGEPVVKTTYDFANFKANFKRLKATMGRNKATANQGDAALKLEQKLYPRPARDFHGNPYYAGSTIRSHLVSDVRSGDAAADKKPLQIVASREQYSHYQTASKTFRNHLYCERRKEIEQAGWQQRRNKEGYKQHELEHREARENSNVG